MDAITARTRLRELHAEGCFVIPNPFDRGSARLLESLGAVALATTSAGLATGRGRPDMGITRDELVAHVADLAPAVGIPLHVDSERLFADDLDGVAETVRLLAEAGAAGCSIEDWDPGRAEITPLPEAVERVAAAASAAAESGVVLTARCEHHLHGVVDLDATIDRLIAYRDAGAEVVYAPAIDVTAADVRRIVEAVEVPVNGLLVAGGLSVAELAEAGVRRVSTGSGLSSAAYGAFVQAARHVLELGTPDATLPGLSGTDVAAAFGA